MIIGQLLQNFDFGQFWQKSVPKKWWNVVFDDKNMFSIKKIVIEIIFYDNRSIIEKFPLQGIKPRPPTWEIRDNKWGLPIWSTGNRVWIGRRTRGAAPSSSSYPNEVACALDRKTEFIIPFLTQPNLTGLISCWLGLYLCEKCPSKIKQS